MIDNAQPTSSILLAKVNSDLSVAWEKKIAASSPVISTLSFDVDALGNVYLLVDGPNNDYVVNVLDPSGAIQLVASVDSTNQPQMVDICTLDGGAYAVFGSYYVSGNLDNLIQIYDATGSLKDEVSYNSPENAEDQALSMYNYNDGIIVVNSVTEISTNELVGKTELRRYDYVDVIEPASFVDKGHLDFVKNNGQLRRTDGSEAEDIAFYAINATPRTYFAKEKISYLQLFNGADETEPDTLKRTEMSFNNLNSGSFVSQYEMKDNFYNYYVGAKERRRERIPVSESILYTDVYRNIDLMISSGQGLTNYTFIIESGASPGQISLNIDAHDPIELLSNGKLLVDGIVFNTPTAYQLNGSAVVNLPWSPSFNLVNDNLGFSTGSFDQSKPLVIEYSIGTENTQTVSTQGLEWSTYYGGSDGPNGGQDNEEALAMAAKGGAVFIGGETWNLDIPTVDILVNEFIGGKDVFITKFEESGKVDWATYLGGAITFTGNTMTARDRVTDIAVDNLQNLYVVGNTFCPDFPKVANNGEYLDPEIFPVTDQFGYTRAYISKFRSNDGILTWSTYFAKPCNAGSANTGINSIAISNENHVFVGGGFGFEIGNCNFLNVSENPIEYTSEEGDSFIAEFTPENNIRWATRIKSPASLQDMELDSENSLYVTGVRTYNIPAQDEMEFVNDGNGYLSTTTGQIYIRKFNLLRDLVWSTRYGGVEDITVQESVYDLAIDGEDNVFLLGNSIGGNSFPVLDAGGYFKSQPSGGSDYHISKFDKNGSQLWATFFGGSKSEFFNCEIFTDNHEDLFLLGTTESDDFDLIALGDQYFQSDFNNTSSADDTDNRDVVMAAFDNQTNLEWSSYFGGASPGGIGEELGSSGVVTESNKLFITGATDCRSIPDIGGTPIPLSDPGGDSYFQGELAGSGVSSTDAFIAKFSLSDLLNSVRSLANRAILSLEIYPTVTHNNIFVKGLQKGELSVVDPYGRSIFMQRIEVDIERFSLNAVDLPTGWYIISLDTGGERYQARFFRQ